jgi:hypothetical protein
LLDREAEHASHVDALGTGRRDASDEFRRHGARAPRIPTIKDRLHLRGVPSHDDIGEQAQGIGDGLHFLVALGLIAGNATRVDRALQGIDRLASVQHPQQFPSENGVHKVVGEEHSAQQLTEMDERFIERIAACGRAEPRERIDGAGVPAVHGGDEVRDLIPVCEDFGEIDIGMADRPDPLRDDGTTWQEQVPILERLQAWTQVKSEQPCQSHRDVGVSVRIDCKLGSLKTRIYARLQTR